MAGFALEKWYADCTTDDGRAVILYSAKLDWRGPAIHYTNLLARGRSRVSLRRQTGLEGMAWRSAKWKAAAEWREPGAAVREMLYESDGGRLEWDCVAPRCTAEVRIGDEHYRGWGYVERLRMTVAPWLLPIRELRWGRFVNATDAVVWIDWRGSYNRRVVYWNGAAVGASAIGDRAIVLDDGSVLSLDETAVLREGALGTTALKMVRTAFPRSILNVRERKWLSRAVLRRPDGSESVGMAIHEVVEW